MEQQNKLFYEGCEVKVGENNWTTEKSIIDGMLQDDVVMLIFDYMQYPDNKIARNLEGYNLKGERLWVAENPVDTPNEAYVEFLGEDDNQPQVVQVIDQAGFQCGVDIKSGNLISVIYTK